jgi:hypothetical protein
MAPEILILLELNLPLNPPGSAGLTQGGWMILVSFSSFKRMMKERIGTFLIKTWDRTS